MLLLLLLLLFGDYTPVVVGAKSLSFHKIFVARNPENVVSVRMHSRSPAMPVMHAMLRFNAPATTGNQSGTPLLYHPALVIDAASMPRYSSVAIDRPPRLEMVARGRRKNFAYKLVPKIHDGAYVAEQQYANSVMQLMASAASAMISFTANLGYDAILSLDAGSSLWNEYDTAVFTCDSLTLSSDHDGEMPTSGAFDRVMRLNCSRNIVASGGKCIVPLSDNSLLPGEDSFTLLIDLTATYNYLPTELYARWLAQTNDLHLTLATTGETLTLGTQYRFQVHEDGAQTIQIGADLLHHMPRVAFSTESNVVTLWYYAQLQGSFAAHEAVAVIFLFLNMATLICLFVLGTSYNFFVLDYLINFPMLARRTFFFAHKQVFYELLAIAFAVTEWFLVGLFSFGDGQSQHDQRTILFLCVSLYHTMIGLFLLLVERESFKSALNVYLPRLFSRSHLVKNAAVTTPQVTEATTATSTEPPPKTLDEKHAREYARGIFSDAGGKATRQRLYDRVVKQYHDPLCKMPMGLVLARNLTLLMLILSNLLLTYNFSSESNSVYLLLCVLISLVAIAFGVGYLVIGVVYVQRFGASALRQNALFCVYWLMELGALVLFSVFVFITTLMPYFEAVNSGYATSVIVVYVLLLLATLIVAAVYFPLSQLYEHIERFIEHKEREIALASAS